MRSITGRLLGTVADLCIGIAAHCLAWQERIDPDAADRLTPEQADHIMAGVTARLAADAPVPFAEPFHVPPGTAITRFQGFH